MRFDDGTELPIPAGMEPREFLRRHRGMALTEGRCPDHPSVTLEIVDGESADVAPTGRPWLHHRGCGSYWRFDPGTDRLDWEVWWSFNGWGRLA